MLSPSQEEAARAVCGIMAPRSGPARGRAERAAEDWRLVNTFGFDDFPPEVQAHAAPVGPHRFYPLCVLAAHAAGRPIPESTNG